MSLKFQFFALFWQEMQSFGLAEDYMTGIAGLPYSGDMNDDASEMMSLYSSEPLHFIDHFYRFCDQFGFYIGGMCHLWFDVNSGIITDPDLTQGSVLTSFEEILMGLCWTHGQSMVQDFLLHWGG